MGKTESDMNWATPQNRDFRTGGVDRYNNPERSKNLNDQILNEPTPNTPSGGAKADGSAPQGMNGGKGHREMMKGEFKPGAKLNPAWVCQLMGLPVGWTQLSTAKKADENRIDRLRLLGNGVVPQTAEKAFITLAKRAGLIE